ncbi:MULTISPECIES: rpoE leader peptide RseD [Atlantibacter]|uniref:rpoE leader peptide RseD n=1 Tax=Atlantibacter TaxID=1903434 RepID=UPI00103D3601|nr:rpoE leader peptide RseD [Atlantibacter hermannii]
MKINGPKKADEKQRRNGTLSVNENPIFRLLTTCVQRSGGFDYARKLGLGRYYLG